MKQAAKVEVHAADLPDHVCDTMCRLLLKAINREKEREAQESKPA